MEGTMVLNHYLSGQSCGQLYLRQHEPPSVLLSTASPAMANHLGEGGKRRLG